MAIKIAVANVKGGCGKSSSSICIAQELISRGKKVLLVDSDGQCNATSFYDAVSENMPTVIDILCGNIPMKDCIQSTEKGDIVPSDIQVFDSETVVKNDEIRFLHYRLSIRETENLYDYIIFDTPPAIGVALKNTLGCVDYVVIPVKEDGWSVEGLIPFQEQVEMAKYTNPNIKVLGIFTTMHDTRSKKRNATIKSVVDKVCEMYETTMFNTKIRISTRVPEALTVYRIPLNKYAKDSNPAIDYKNLTDEILERIGD